MGSLALLSALVVSQVATAPRVAASPSVPLVRIDVADAATLDALCNDGSPAAYYFRAGHGDGKNRWVISLAGGWNCRSVAECDARWQSSPQLMSSTTWPATMQGVGLLGASASNVDFATANHVYVRYCSSDLWAGDRAPSLATGGWAFYGARILDAIVAQLGDAAHTPTPNLRAATEVLLLGHSAGGVGILASLDRVAAQIKSMATQSPTLKVRGLSDAGWGVDVAPAVGGQALADYLSPGVAFWNAQLDSDCVIAQTPFVERCLLGDVLAPHLQTPIFVSQSYFDTAQTGLLALAPPYDASNPTSWALKLAITASLASVTGAYVGLAPNHGYSGNPFAPQIAGLSLATVLGNWFFDRPGPKRLLE